MIFVTIGTQEPFDRLVKVMDEIASIIDKDVIIQTINTNYNIKHMKHYEFLSPNEYAEILKETSLIISHAGMGTIISALTNNKPIIIMPRLASLGEHRNEHQLATAKKIKELSYAYVADDEIILKNMILDLIKKNKIEPLHKEIGKYASESLVFDISEYINNI